MTRSRRDVRCAECNTPLDFDRVPFFDPAEQSAYCNRDKHVWYERHPEEVAKLVAQHGQRVADLIIYPYGKQGA